jgi:hypothetical protein
MANVGSLSTLFPDERRTHHLPRRTTGILLVAAGLTLYTLSFFLWAIGDRQAAGNPTRGYFCAQFALLYPWGVNAQRLLKDTPLFYFSLLLSGWVNPSFLGAAIFEFLRESVRRPLSVAY